jgi:hypothetical protein
VAKWIPLPAEPLKYQPFQDDFWRKRRQRVCQQCKVEYDSPPNAVCPRCSARGLRKFHRLTLLAGRRGGKTRAGSIAGAEEASIPNTIGWACAPTAPKLSRYVIPAFQQIIPVEWVADWKESSGDLWLKNGSLIHFQTLEDPDQGRGQGLDWLWIDEVCELTKKHWETISPSLTEKRGGAFFTTSPRSFDWVYEELYRRAEQGMPGYWAAKYQTSANPIISQDELDEAKLTMSDAMYRQEYEADFVIFTGAVYGGVIAPQILKTTAQIQSVLPEWPEIAPWRQVLIGIDTGADHPFGAVKLVSCDQGFVVVDEYLERDRTFLQHATNIKSIARSATAKYAINKNERQQSLELAQHGIFCQKAENDVVSGTERVKSWLQTRQLWFIEASCPKTISQMMSYRWAEPSQRDGQLRKERVFKLEDELPDCVRYALMTWPISPKAPTPEANKLRDISQLPEEMQGTIKRMRRSEGRVKDEKDSVVMDFWN